MLVFGEEGLDKRELAFRDSLVGRLQADCGHHLKPCDWKKSTQSGIR